jgi:polar amino acid transport system substrate-binding protein
VKITRNPILLPGALLALALLVTAAHVEPSAASASATTPDATQRRPLLVVVEHIEPEYKAGAKHRSPATIDAELAADLAGRLQMPLLTSSAENAKPGSGASAGKGALRLTAVSDPGAVPAAYAAVPIRYSAAPMAIMRADTAIKSWEQLKDRAVCVARDGRHVGALASRYGAIEKVYPSVTDALIGLRSGACDAAVHDSAMLEELIRLPEWKKFSARLPAVQESTLAFLVPARDTTTLAKLKQVTNAWKAEGYPDTLMKKAVRNIAFEVYLEQDVPDCH